MDVPFFSCVKCDASLFRIRIRLTNGKTVFHVSAKCNGSSRWRQSNGSDRGGRGGGGAGPSESIPDQSGSTNHAHRPPAVMIRP